MSIEEFDEEARAYRESQVVGRWEQREVSEQRDGARVARPSSGFRVSTTPLLSEKVSRATFVLRSGILAGGDYRGLRDQFTASFYLRC
jgi:hypothetical protein